MEQLLTAAGLAALFWMAFVALIFLTLLGYIESAPESGLAAILFFIIAVAASSVELARSKRG